MVPQIFPAAVKLCSNPDPNRSDTMWPKVYSVWLEHACMRAHTLCIYTVALPHTANCGVKCIPYFTSAHFPGRFWCLPAVPHLQICVSCPELKKSGRFTSVFPMPVCTAWLPLWRSSASSLRPVIWCRTPPLTTQICTISGAGGAA